MDSFVSLIQAAVVFGTVIMFGAVGETLTEKSGNLNLGVPGIMYLGAIASLTSTFFYENAMENPSMIVCVLIALVCGVAASMLGGLVYSFLTITLRANQNVSGLALSIFGSGVANFFGGSLNKLAGGVGQISVATTSTAFRMQIPVLSKLGVFGKIFFSYGFMMYLAIIIAIVMQYFLSRSRAGLNLRAVGENPATADAAGINVVRNKYLATCIGAGISGLGGIYYVMDYIKGTWANDGSIEKLGWLAVARRASFTLLRRKISSCNPRTSSWRLSVDCWAFSCWPSSAESDSTTSSNCARRRLRSPAMRSTRALLLFCSSSAAFSSASARPTSTSCWCSASNSSPRSFLRAVRSSSNCW